MRGGGEPRELSGRARDDRRRCRRASGSVIKREMERVADRRRPAAAAGLGVRGAIQSQPRRRRCAARDAHGGERQLARVLSRRRFDQRPGLESFTRARSRLRREPGAPLCQAVVRGTRLAFPPKSGWPHPGRIEIEFLEPIFAQADTPEAVAIESRDGRDRRSSKNCANLDLVADRLAVA